MQRGASDISNAEMALFCRQFGSLVHAEVNILQVLESLKAQTEKPYFREVIDSIRRDLEMGRPLATAFSRYPQSFSPFFISMVRQGELEGELDKAFMMLAEHFETRMGARVEADRTKEAGVFDIQSAMSVLNHFFV
ncbi:MAG: type II secretion system F family protein, partial [Armatimonadota bacterium]